jgi:predicted Zn-dependent protease
MAAAVAALLAGPSYAGQFGGLDKVGKVTKKAQQFKDIEMTDEDEQELGAAVSQKIRTRYGVVQDPAIHRYVTLVGTVLAQASSRPNLSWKFIVLDTDGVNALAAPGGYIHITRGALSLMKSEAELGDVLAHELIHVTEKHTIRAIQKGKLVQLGADRTKLTRDSPIFRELVAKSTEIVMAGFGRDDELESDQKGVRLANSVGYAPSPFADFLARLAERNQASAGKQGLFASHPEMQERIRRLRSQVSGERLASAATLAPRYLKFISYTATDQAEIATVEEGAAGLTGSAAKKTPPPPPRKGFGLGSLRMNTEYGIRNTECRIDAVRPASWNDKV